METRKARWSLGSAEDRDGARPAAVGGSRAVWETFLSLDQGHLLSSSPARLYWEKSKGSY